MRKGRFARPRKPVAPPAEGEPFAGRPLVLVFCGCLSESATRAVLERCAATQGMLAAGGAMYVAQVQAHREDAA